MTPAETLRAARALIEKPEAITPVTLLEFSREHMDRAEMFRAHGMDRTAALHFEVAELANDLSHAINQAEIAEHPILSPVSVSGAIWTDEACAHVGGGVRRG